jgi:SPP1 gp7 family putative phage head morphogenesis protein
LVFQKGYRKRMKEIVLAPIVQSHTLAAGVQADLIAYFKETIFNPLLELLSINSVSTKRQNVAGDAVIQALKERKIWYSAGVFTGTFSAAISRELRAAGATKDEKSFKLSVDKLPMDWRLAIEQSQQVVDQINKQVVDLLGQIESNIEQAPTGVNLKFSLDGVFVDLRKQLKKTLETSGVGVPPELNENVKADITKEYTENINLLIKDFAKKLIPEMRLKIQDNIFAGGRTDKLVKIIETQYGVSTRKAAFLAEQETSLLVSKYRESRYREVGSRRYVWGGSNDSRERPDHKLLNGKTFYWDSPPITNRATGARNNPGEDFGCRCVARPILPIQDD